MVLERPLKLHLPDEDLLSHCHRTLHQVKIRIAAQSMYATASRKVTPSRVPSRVRSLPRPSTPQATGYRAATQSITHGLIATCRDHQEKQNPYSRAVHLR